ncbi:hypothetical protein NDU88_002117 [Pleurodeles waltl]|uniref:Uncharacterized protein n=1 Tax=Pleurodeles waltl TaxID=8319 RepID=A0AAV7LZZ1_PLEWA|nr:hypothetical protein NDU88_002117 [Pleurodeles waltl]
MAAERLHRQWRGIPGRPRAPGVQLPCTQDCLGYADSATGQAAEQSAFPSPRARLGREAMLCVKGIGCALRWEAHRRQKWPFCFVEEQLRACLSGREVQSSRGGQRVDTTHVDKCRGDHSGRQLCCPVRVSAHR